MNTGRSGRSARRSLAKAGSDRLVSLPRRSHDRAHRAVIAASGLFVTAASIAVLPIALVTLGRARRLYAAYTARVARVLLWFWGVRVNVHGSFPLPARQVVYVSNHSSTIDLFVLTALGLPNTRFFLSGFLQKFVPLAILARLMGTFFTVPQSRTEDRRRIFRRACDAAAQLRRVRVSQPRRRPRHDR